MLECGETELVENALKSPVVSLALSELATGKNNDVIIASNHTRPVPDQWQTQIMLRVLMHATVIYISEMPDETVEEMHMIPAQSIEEATKKQKKFLIKKM